MALKNKPQIGKRTHIGIVRELFPEVEALSHAGYTIAYIHNQFKKEGKTSVSVRHFGNLVSLVRKEHLTKNTLQPPPSAQKNTAASVKAPQKKDLEDILNSPVDLNFYSNLTNKE